MKFKVREIKKRRHFTMARVKGKSSKGNQVSFDFNSSRAAERFCEMWGWFYDDGTETYTLEIIDFA